MTAPRRAALREAVGGCAQAAARSARSALSSRAARAFGPVRRDGMWRVADGWMTSGMADLAQRWPAIVDIDLETTGYDPVHDRIIEIGLVAEHADGRTEEWSTLVDPRRRVPREVLGLTGIDPGDLRSAPGVREALAELSLRVPTGAVLSAYGAGFDRAHLQNASRRTGVALPIETWGCVLDLARRTLRDERRPRNFKLTTVCEHMGVPLDHAHRARHDARASRAVRRALLETTQHENR